MHLIKRTNRIWIGWATVIALTVAAAAFAQGLAPGNTAPAFTAKDINGKTISMPKDFKNKVVLLDFWATWCGPCRAEVPHLRDAYARYQKRGFEILSVSVDRDTNAARNYVKENKMTWRHVLDADNRGEASRLYKIEFIPTTVLLDGSTGKVIATGLRGEALGQAVDKALKERKR